MTYETPLDRRLYEAARQKRAYWSDPAERLKMVNRTRTRRGLPPHDSPDQIVTLPEKVRRLNEARWPR